MRDPAYDDQTWMYTDKIAEVKLFFSNLNHLREMSYRQRILFHFLSYCLLLKIFFFIIIITRYIFSAIYKINTEASMKMLASKRGNCDHFLTKLLHYNDAGRRRRGQVGNDRRTTLSKDRHSADVACPLHHTLQSGVIAARSSTLARSKSRVTIDLILIRYIVSYSNESFSRVSTLLPIDKICV